MLREIGETVGNGVYRDTRSGNEIKDLTAILFETFEMSSSVADFKIKCAASNIDLDDPYVTMTMKSIFMKLLSRSFDTSNSDTGASITKQYLDACQKAKDLIESEWSAIEEWTARDASHVISDTVYFLSLLTPSGGVPSEEMVEEFKNFSAYVLGKLIGKPTNEGEVK